MRAKVIAGNVTGDPEKHKNSLEKLLNEWLATAKDIKEIKYVQFSDYSSNGVGHCAVVVFYEELPT